MTPAAFRATTTKDTPPSGLSLPLQALWWAAKGDWNTAHERAQTESSPDSAWVHAYLHRVEGDANNAAHWYRQAGKTPCQLSLSTEWTELVEALL